MAKRKKESFRQRSQAAKLGWLRRRKGLTESKAETSNINLVKGPHGRATLMKDWDGFLDRSRMEKAVKDKFPRAKNWNWSAYMYFPENEGFQWISIGFDITKQTKGRVFRQQSENIKDLIESYKDRYKGAIPVQLAVTVR